MAATFAPAWQKQYPLGRPGRDSMGNLMSIPSRQPQQDVAVTDGFTPEQLDSRAQNVREIGRLKRFGNRLPSQNPASTTQSVGMLQNALAASNAAIPGEGAMRGAIPWMNQQDQAKRIAAHMAYGKPDADALDAVQARAANRANMRTARMNGATPFQAYVLNRNGGQAGDGFGPLELSMAGAPPWLVNAAVEQQNAKMDRDARLKMAGQANDTQRFGITTNADVTRAGNQLQHQGVIDTNAVSRENNQNTNNTGLRIAEGQQAGEDRRTGMTTDANRDVARISQDAQRDVANIDAGSRIQLANINAGPQYTEIGASAENEWNKRRDLEAERIRNTYKDDVNAQNEAMHRWLQFNQKPQLAVPSVGNGQVWSMPSGAVAPSGAPVQNGTAGGVPVPASATSAGVPDYFGRNSAAPAGEDSYLSNPWVYGPPAAVGTAATLRYGPAAIRGTGNAIRNMAADWSSLMPSWSTGGVSAANAPAPTEPTVAAPPKAAITPTAPQSGNAPSWSSTMDDATAQANRIAELRAQEMAAEALRSSSVSNIVQRPSPAVSSVTTLDNPVAVAPQNVLHSQPLDAFMPSSEVSTIPENLGPSWTNTTTGDRVVNGKPIFGSKKAQKIAAMRQAKEAAKTAGATGSETASWSRTPRGPGGNTRKGAMDAPQFESGLPAESLQPRSTALTVQPRSTALTVQPRSTALTVQPRSTALTVQPRSTALTVQPRATASRLGSWLGKGAGALAAGDLAAQAIRGGSSMWENYIKHQNMRSANPDMTASEFGMTRNEYEKFLQRPTDEQMRLQNEALAAGVSVRDMADENDTQKMLSFLEGGLSPAERKRARQVSAGYRSNAVPAWSW